MTDVIALDVSMGKSYCVWYRHQKCLKEFPFSHTKAGFQKLLGLANGASDPVIYFEATGIYSRVIERFCEEHQLCYSRLNPLEVHLKSATLRQLKTDQKDAHRIALTVIKDNFHRTIPWPRSYQKLRELSRFYNQLNDDWKYQLNLLHAALEQTFPELKQLFANCTSQLALNMIGFFPHPDFVGALSRVRLKNKLLHATTKCISKEQAYKYADHLIKLAQNSYPAVTQDSVQVDKVRYYVHQLLALTQTKKQVVAKMKRVAHQLPEYRFYCSFPGIGEQTAAQLMGELGDISRFANANQLNAYVGIDIKRYQSGIFIGQEHINKRGNSVARKLLYFAVGNMIRCQRTHPNHIVDYYYHLREKHPYPKSNKVAIVACINKTLKCLLAMINHHECYHYRALSA